MSDIQIFNNEQFGQVRVITKDNEPWFVGKDVSEILGYLEPNKAITRHTDEDDRIKHPITDNLKRVQETWVINESGLYSLILGSKLPVSYTHLDVYKRQPYIYPTEVYTFITPYLF